ncbi:hypothetical protein GEMRC1_002717 [Eukaryota sp. GEM-RC1]
MVPSFLHQIATEAKSQRKGVLLLVCGSPLRSDSKALNSLLEYSYLWYMIRPDSSEHTSLSTYYSCTIPSPSALIIDPKTSALLQVIDLSVDHDLISPLSSFTHLFQQGHLQSKRSSRKRRVTSDAKSPVIKKPNPSLSSSPTTLSILIRHNNGSSVVLEMDEEATICDLLESLHLEPGQQLTFSFNNKPLHPDLRLLDLNMGQRFALFVT